MATPHHDNNYRESQEPLSTTNLLRRDNPNVFSDDYALEAIGTSGRSSPVSQLSAEDHVMINRSSSPPSGSPTPRPSINIHHTLSNDDHLANIRRSMSKTTPPRQSTHYHSQSRSRSTTSRTSSASSRFSIPRSQSPFVGASGPSQPYGMYPQATRLSTVTTGSTVRAPERAFVRGGGPEHPYGMYSQNTVPVDDDPGPAALPVGFSGEGQNYQRTRGPEGDDYVDIVGPDGHTEQLPPYSRYADNVAPKVAAEYADTPPDGQPSRMSAAPRLSTRSISQQSQMGILEPDSPSEQSPTSDSSGSFKEKVKSTGRRRICCGVQLWVIAAILGVLLLGGLLGGIVGAVVGNKKGQEDETASPPSNTDLPAVTVTQTSWIDANPLPTGTNLPPIPQGKFNIPTSDVKLASNSCITDLTLIKAWDCLPPNGIGINLTTPDGPGRPRPIAIVDPYPLPANFTYGPQLPDLGGQQFPLMPAMDKHSGSLGPALFFYTFYDKLVILPPDKITLPSPGLKRSAPSELSERDLAARGGGNDGDGGGGSHRRQQMAQSGDEPWFCFWNQTVLEIFIYVNQNTTEQLTASFSSPNPSTSPGAAAASSDIDQTTESIATGTDATTTAPTSIATTALSDSGSEVMTAPSILSLFSSIGGAMPTGPPSPMASSLQPRGDGNGNGGHHMASNDYVNYPRFVKVEEKRKPASQGNVQPYCQQMRVLDNGQVVPIPDNVVQIKEAEPEKMVQHAAEWTGRFMGRRAEAVQVEERDAQGMMGGLSTNCCCEWLSS